ncbi:hypothetical protein [Cupriavidus sp. AU9028]|uniref:hypothetical protein n=1 Tax=Cupriavidus sp. AU9028 TaxID=2871157 RepID=UPI001C9403EF|nr:hypothetical protein [Cupriavidus sp. AU9028]MBY4896247.1 hypothetical protein [Cupriavidus sp. AU9028]
MNNLVHILTGLGDVLGAFGTVRRYDVPKRGDTVRDAKNIYQDACTVQARLDKNTTKALQQNGSIKERSGQTR